jgi:hypothetical protein
LPVEHPTSLTLLETLAHSSKKNDEGIAAVEHLERLAPHLVPGCSKKIVAQTFGAPNSEDTSFKIMAQKRVPVIVEKEQVLQIRQDLRLYGVDRLRRELGDLVDENGNMTIGTEPMNFFARVAADLLPKMNLEEQREFARRQSALGPYAKQFYVIANKKERQRASVVATHREVGTKDNVKGKAGMSERHEFLIPRQRHWQFFNALTLGLVKNGLKCAEAIEMLQEMKSAVNFYTRNSASPWSKNVGMFFHCYPNVGEYFMMLHIIDMDALGPSFGVLKDKNLDIDVLLSALRAETEIDRQAQIEAATTTEFQQVFRGLDSTLKRTYSEMYLEKLSSTQKEKMRRNRLYSTKPLAWQRQKAPLERLNERLDQGFTRDSLEVHVQGLRESTAELR